MPAVRYAVSGGAASRLIDSCASSDARFWVDADTVLELCFGLRIVEVQGGTKRWSGL
jgi:hypothetical protein